VGHLDAAAALAREIRRLRKRAGLSQAELAAAVGYTREYVSRSERARSGLASAALVEGIDQILHAGGALVALHARAAAERLTRRSEPPRSRARRSSPTTPEARVGAARPASEQDASSGDRDPLEASATTSADFLAWAEPSNVGDMTVDQIQADIREISRAYLKVDTEPLLVRTGALRDRIFQLLRGRQKPVQTRELFSAAGWALTLLAWMSVDLGHPEAAETHLRAARVCADNADHDLLACWVAATRHTTAFWRDDYASAAEHALAGVRTAPPGTGAALFLASALALDLARQGDWPRARQALATARRRADELRVADADGVAGPFACTIGRAGGFWADAHQALREPQPALRLAGEAIAAFEASPPSQRNYGSERMVRCEQVKAYLALGDFDGAFEAFQPVLATTSECRVGPLRRRVAEIAALARSDNANTGQLRTIAEAAIDFAPQPAKSARRSLP
jgi:transcriptional regulator with XRE-family HTH domain